MEEQPNQPAEPTEEELRAAYEEQLKRIRVDDVLVQTVVSLVNLGGYKLQESDLDQVGQAIEGTRAILPLVEEALGPDAGQIRAALSQLQLAYAREVGAGDAPAEDKPAEEATGPGPAQSSGRLWVPGQ
jgi:hypothetical protein